MSLPGVRTVLQDRFFTLARTDVPEGSRVIGVARRGQDKQIIEEPAVIEEGAVPASLDENNDGEVYLVNGTYREYSQATAGDVGTWTVLGYAEGALVPDYRPFAPRSEETVINQFGQGSELHRCFLEMMQGGVSRVYLLPVPYDLEDADFLSLVDPMDTDGPTHLDQIFDGVELIRPDAIAFWGRGGHVDDSPRIGFHASSGNSALVAEIASKCKLITDRSNPCFAVLGLEPADGEEKLGAGQTKAHLETNLPGYRESVLNGQYVTVVGVEMKPTAYLESFGWANGAATYASFVSTLPSEVGATGKRVPDVQDLRYGLTRPQQIEVIDAGVVPVAYDSLDRVRVIDALTFAAPPSDYTRLSTLRIVFDTVQLVRQATEPFVGQPSTLHHRNSMETAVSSALRNMQVAGALLGSDFVVTYLARENKAQIDLVLIPAFEMRNIEVSVAVQL
ncbi:MAG: hypothetical protein LC687_06820 [Actinobacteria bacterium]|nr:hypothetical protein [Actinomycetota bacterium]